MIRAGSMSESELRLEIGRLDFLIEVADPSTNTRAMEERISTLQGELKRRGYFNV